jgi:hypothetical protein
MKHVRQLSRPPKTATTIDAATKIEFYADLLSALEPILEAKGETTS